VTLKQGPADILIQTVCEEIIESLQSGFQLSGGRTIFDACFEQLGKPLQTILIHVVNQSQICNAEEQQTSSESH